MNDDTLEEDIKRFRTRWMHERVERTHGEFLAIGVDVMFVTKYNARTLIFMARSEAEATKLARSLEQSITLYVIGTTTFADTVVEKSGG